MPSAAPTVGIEGHLEDVDDGRRLLQFFNAVLEAQGRGVVLGSFPGEQLRVQLEQLEVRLGRRVDEPPLHLLEGRGHGVGAPRELGHERLQLRPHRVAAEVLDGLQKLAAHGIQGLLRPGLEPVDDRAVDERGELEAAHAERVADGREAQHDVQGSLNGVERRADGGAAPRVTPALYVYSTKCLRRSTHAWPQETAVRSVAAEAPRGNTRHDDTHGQSSMSMQHQALQWVGG